MLTWGQALNAQVDALANSATPFAMQHGDPALSRMEGPGVEGGDGGEGPGQQSADTVIWT